MNTARSYSLQIDRDAWRDLMKLSEALRETILDAIYSLEMAPRPSGCKKLKGGEGLYRIRVGDYRVVYEIEDAKLVVVVVKIGNRKDIYD
jgi:mRNA interferase RelE/StbE